MLHGCGCHGVGRGQSAELAPARRNQGLCARVGHSWCQPALTQIFCWSEAEWVSQAGGTLGKTLQKVFRKEWGCETEMGGRSSRGTVRD